jgi:hypothetical protein
MEIKIFSVEKTARMIYENENDFGIVRDAPGGMGYSYLEL